MKLISFGLPSSLENKIASSFTDVRVAFPRLSTLVEEFKVFVATGASITITITFGDAAWQCSEAARALIMNWLAVAFEPHRDWRNHIEGFGKLLSNHLPAYKNLTTSYAALTK